MASELETVRYNTITNSKPKYMYINALHFAYFMADVLKFKNIYTSSTEHNIEI